MKIVKYNVNFKSVSYTEFARSNRWSVVVLIMMAMLYIVDFVTSICVTDKIKYDNNITAKQRTKIQNHYGLFAATDEGIMDKIYKKLRYCFIHRVNYRIYCSKIKLSELKDEINAGDNIVAVNGIDNKIYFNDTIIKYDKFAVILINREIERDGSLQEGCLFLEFLVLLLILTGFFLVVKQHDIFLNEKETGLFCWGYAF